VFVPKGETVGSDAAVLAMLDRNRDATAATATTAASQGQDRYRVYTNAKNVYHNFGSALGITYVFYKKFTVAGNVNFNKMKANKTITKSYLNDLSYKIVGCAIEVHKHLGPDYSNVFIANASNRSSFFEEQILKTNCLSR